MLAGACVEIEHACMIMHMRLTCPERSADWPAPAVQMQARPLQLSCP